MWHVASSSFWPSAWLLAAELFPIFVLVPDLRPLGRQAGGEAIGHHAISYRTAVHAIDFYFPNYLASTGTHLQL